MRAALRREAQRRLVYVLDTGVSIAGAFSKGDTLKDHLADLTEATKHGDDE